MSTLTVIVVQGKRFQISLVILPCELRARKHKIEDRYRLSDGSRAPRRPYSSDMRRFRVFVLGGLVVVQLYRYRAILGGRDWGDLSLMFVFLHSQDYLGTSSNENSEISLAAGGDRPLAKARGGSTQDDESKRVARSDQGEVVKQDDRSFAPIESKVSRAESPPSSQNSATEWNRFVLQTAPIVQDLSHIPANTTIDHSHMGAQDENGNLGYLHDAKSLRMNPPSFQYPNLLEACQRRDSNYDMIDNRIVVTVLPTTEERRTKIFCVVYTTESKHNTALNNIRQTWGYVHFSTETFLSLR
jgi:hypothetical protein